MSERYVGKIVRLIDKFKVVLNKGAEHGVKFGNEFVIVTMGDEVVDPETSEVLERLEIVRGKVKAIHVQPRITTLESSEYQSTGQTTTRRQRSLFGPTDETVIEPPQELKKLEGVSIGDYVIHASRW